MGQEVSGNEELGWIGRQAEGALAIPNNMRGWGESERARAAQEVLKQTGRREYTSTMTPGPQEGETPVGFRAGRRKRQTPGLRAGKEKTTKVQWMQKILGHCRAIPPTAAPAEARVLVW